MKSISVGPKAIAVSSPEAEPAATAAEATSGVAATTAVGAQPSDGFAVRPPAVDAAAAQPDVLTPALSRAFYTAAQTLESKGDDDAVQLARKAMAQFGKSPEALAAFQQALPYLESGAATVGQKIGAPQIGAVAKATLPLLMNGQTAKALLKTGQVVGGDKGLRLVGAALRGLRSGGMVGAAAHISATATKIAAKAPALAAAATPLNFLAVGSSLKGIYDTLKNPAHTKADLLSGAMHLAATVTGCFIPGVGAVAVAMDAKRALT